MKQNANRDYPEQCRAKHGWEGRRFLVVWVVLFPYVLDQINPISSVPTPRGPSVLFLVDTVADKAVRKAIPGTPHIGLHGAQPCLRGEPFKSRALATELA